MPERKLRYDVVVVGGGSAGVAAAVGASNVGLRTLLIEKNPYFGGASTHSSVLTICGFFAQSEPLTQVIGGVGNMFLEKLEQLGAYTGPVRNPGSGNVIVPLESEPTKFALDQLVVESGVTPRLHCQVISAIVENGSIQAIECYDHGGRFLIEASAFVDASGEANLSTHVGANVRFGDAEGSTQAGTLVMRIGGVSPEHAFHRHQFTAAIWQAKRAGMEHLTKDRGMTLRLPLTNHVLALFADESVNGLDSVSLTDAEMSARRQCWSYLEAFREYVPGFKDAFLVQTGPSIGVRETRHVKGEYQLTGEDALNGVRFDDAIARGGWPVEVHQPGQAAVYTQIRDKSYYDIPLRALKVSGISNLWTGGRIIDCDATAFGSARVMGTAFGTGHAAGVAAAHYASMKRVDPTEVRRELSRQGAFV